MPQPRFKFIDLFSGAGGLTKGFVDAGFEPILAVEREPDYSRTYAVNFGDHVLTGDIARLTKHQDWDVRADLVIGGPPCQGFSNLTGNKASDPRRSMWRHFMDIVERSECKMFLVENVPNLLRSDEGAALIRRAERSGFLVSDNSAKILLASDFGVPQNRRRAFIVGSRLGECALPVANGRRRMSVREAFKGIPLKPVLDEIPRQPASGSDLHVRRKPRPSSLARYRAVPPGGNRFDLQKSAPELTPDCWIRKTSGGTDLFGRLEWDAPARCTIRTEFYKPEKGRYLHPEEHRPITHWEAARLQSFPDSFMWTGSKISIAVQIGNAVPPRLGNAIAEEMFAHLQKHGARPVRRATREEIDELRQRLGLSSMPMFESA